MANTTISPNMTLPIPTVGVDPGPDWANNVNASLTIIDGHNHTTGSGVQLTPNSLNINIDLPMNNNDLITTRSVRFQPQSSSLSQATDIGCLYEFGADLYFNDGAGNHIRLTQSGSIVGTAGSISGLPSGTASASYASGTFVFQSATNTPANVDAGSYIYRNNTAGSHGLTLAPPSAMAADYGLVLPPLPSVKSIMALDTSGNMTAPYTVDNTSITISSNIISVATNPAFAGTGTYSGRNVVLSNTNNSGGSLAIVRGVIDSSTLGSIVSGEGFTIAKSATGVVAITFTTAFLDNPAIVCTSFNNVNAFIACDGANTAGFTMHIYNITTGVNIDCRVSFIAIAVKV